MRKSLALLLICIIISTILTTNSPVSFATSSNLRSTTVTLKIDSIKALELSDDSPIEDGKDEILASWILTEVDETGGLTNNTTYNEKDEKFAEKQVRNDYNELSLEINDKSTVRALIGITEQDNNNIDNIQSCVIDAGIAVALLVFGTKIEGLGLSVAAIECLTNLAISEVSSASFNTIELIVPHSFSGHQFKGRVQQSAITGSAEYEILYTVTYRNTKTNRKERVIDNTLDDIATLGGTSYSEETIKREHTFSNKAIDERHLNFVMTAAIRYHDNHDKGHCGFSFRQNDSNFYLISLYKDGTMHFFERTDDTWQDIPEPERTPPSMRNARHSTNYLMIVAIDDLFTAYVNGQYAGQFRNSNRDNKDISLMVMSTEGEVECNFRNVWVFGLD